jgi:hypothetical protein
VRSAGPFCEPGLEPRLDLHFGLFWKGTAKILAHDRLTEAEHLEGGSEFGCGIVFKSRFSHWILAAIPAPVGEEAHSGPSTD